MKYFIGYDYDYIGDKDLGVFDILTQDVCEIDALSTVTEECISTFFPNQQEITRSELLKFIENYKQTNNLTLTDK